ncbi:MAG: ClbS/DfsB family four-helix bundle protein [Anaerolineae bacterium]|nr:ClbS/DfsB family four-helix bundle protein [Anaerolineae bacterium]
MDTTTEITIERIKSGYTNILNLCREIHTASLESPSFADGWSIKDTLANISAWVWRCAILLDHSHHTNGPLAASPDVEGLNHEFYIERKDWSWYEVESDFRQSHRALLKAIRQMPPSRLTNPLAQELVALNTWQHYARYIPKLEAWCHRSRHENSQRLNHIKQQQQAPHVGAL